MTTPAWVSLHVFHTDPLDRVITEAVGPLVHTLTDEGRIEGYFFLRYWESGPHLRLRLRPTGPQAAGEVRQLATDRLHAYLAAHPSPRPVTMERYAALCEHLAARENLLSYDRTLRPNNSVAEITYQPEYDYYGTGESMAAVERHFVESSQLALQILAGAPPPQQRALTGLAMLVLALATYEPNPAQLAIWFGTAQMLRDLAAAAGDTTEFEGAYQRQREPLHRDVARLWETATSPCKQRGCDGILGEWHRSTRALSDRLSALEARRDTSREILSRCAHLMCNRLGLSVRQEIYLRYLVARAVSDMNQKS